MTPSPRLPFAWPKHSSMQSHHQCLNQVSGSNISARLSVGFGVGFIVILAALHVLEPEFNPPHLISEYELGRFGWLMSIAFFSLGAASLNLAHALWSRLPFKSGHRALLWLSLIGIAYFSAGIFRPRPGAHNQLAQIENFLHAVSGAVVMFSSPIVFGLFAMTLSQHAWSSDGAQIMKYFTILVWLSTFAFIASGFAGITNPLVGGWTNRFVITSYSAWLMAAAWIAINREPVIEAA
jgi:hypothetical protein